MSCLLHAGISQSYISQWLLQQGLEMSDSKRRAFYRWYLLERNNPGECGGRLVVRELLISGTICLLIEVWDH